MRRFLITGANGFIGTNLVSALRTYIQEPYEVALVDIASPQIELANNETWYNTSLLDEAAVKEAFTKAQPQIVIN